MKKWMTNLAMAAFAVLATMAVAQPASAQASRTWISGVGDDANPCSRTAPCRTFAGSISKTAAGGEINCLDPGSFGAVTITKAIKLLCDNTTASISASGTNGITVNAGANDIVVISGLVIDGKGNGLDGIRFLAGGGLHVRNTRISGFGTATSYGIRATPSSGSTIILDRVTIAKTGVANNSGGMLVQPAAGVAATVTVNDSVFTDLGGIAIRLDTAGLSGSTVRAVINKNVFTDAGGAVFARVASGSTANVLVTDNVIRGGQNGIVSQDAGAAVYASGNMVTQNSAYGVRSLLGGALISYGDNELINNGNNGVFTGTASKQ